MKTFTLTVTADEANVIGAALGKMPFDAVAQLLGKLQGQINEQQAAEIPAPKKKEAKTS